MLSRAFLRLVDLLPLPSLRVQRIIAFAVILSQAGISVTGAIVRVTSSGLGCPTWPQCFPGSFTPVVHAEVPVLHQVVEFSNRLLTFVVTLFAALVVLAVVRARRRREVVVYAWLMPGGTVLQAVIGGITVRTGLLWWTVAVHLLASMLMVWLAVLLFAKIGEPDDGVDVVQAPRPLRLLTALSGIALCATMIAGTLVTGAGPHAGDKSVERAVERLQVEIVTLVHLHAELLIAYLALLVGLACGLAAVGMNRALRLRLITVIALVCAQGLVGVVQYFTDVPAALVAVHVGGAAACTAATAALWAAMRNREQVTATAPEPVAQAS
ncbi:COX15/CtaA family protein [Nocardia blacklockiae]|uniref:COX15/CtaA family protein n=1 Tax=Nocardia blacklockiae TaxID=480036 RepID=UPI001895F714|nr:COX15/CtaA family protein [Nocardia blacklockiae]MBF6176680.1 heme A synthase [Nocardia blacklockiae]